MHSCLLSLGANLGDRQSTLQAVVSALRELPGIERLRASRWSCSRPLGGPAGQAEFLNGAVLVDTTISPFDLLQEVWAIETRFGRQRSERWAARTIDIDLLLYDELVILSHDLTLPHARMSFRPFVLEPAAELAGSWRHPCLNVTVARLWNQLRQGLDRVLLYGGSAQQHRALSSELSNAFHQVSVLEHPPVVLAGVAEPQSWLAVQPARSVDPPPRATLPKLSIRLAPIPRAGRAASGAADNGWLFGVPTLSVDQIEADALRLEARTAMMAVWPHLGRGKG